MEVGVLVVAALPEELDAARDAGLSGGPGRPGVDSWTDRQAGRSLPYLRGEFRTSGGGSVSVALARPAQMGGRATAPYVTGLVEQLRPACVAMSGVCAGNPDDTALGDVVVAEPVYEWDEGKLTPGGLVGDQRQFRLDPRWLREAQNFDPSRLPSYGAASEDEALMWLLERLHRGHDPRRHPARSRYFPPGTWGPRLDQWRSGGWITRDPDGTPHLAEAATTVVQRRLYDDVDGPQRLPYAVRVAPMASGSAVVADGGIWKQLAAMGVRKIAAVEMEAATIATIAHDREVPRWLVVKGVMDHANSDKDDRYKGFAARASAEVLFALIDRLAGDLPSAGVASRGGSGDRGSGIGGAPGAGVPGARAPGARVSGESVPSAGMPGGGMPRDGVPGDGVLNREAWGRGASGRQPFLADQPRAATPRVGSDGAPRGSGSLAGLNAVVSALLSLSIMRDDQQRRTVLDLLPERIRTSISDYSTARLHVVSVVQTCQRFPDGAQALLGALSLALGHDSPEVDRVAAAMEEHWEQH